MFVLENEPKEDVLRRLQHCVTDALRDREDSKVEQTYQEIIALIYKFAK